MAVNERVITTLFSSAQGSLKVWVQSFSRILSGIAGHAQSLNRFVRLQEFGGAQYLGGFTGARH